MPAGSIVQKDIVESFMNDLSESDNRRGMVIVANKGNGLRTVYPSINGSEPDIENILDSGSQIVAIDRCIAIGLDITWDPNITVRMEDVHGGLASTLGLAKNVPFKFGDITVYLQCHVQNRAPFEVLLGRPFDVLTESEVRTFGNGDTEIKIKDPNSSKKVTMGMFSRGQKPKQARIDQSRYNSEPTLVSEMTQESTPKETDVNFQTSMI